MPVCPNCGRDIPPESRFCSYCSFDLVAGTKPITIDASQQVHAQVEKITRTLGLSLIALIWALIGLADIVSGLSTANQDYSALQYLSNPAVQQWYQFGVPAELTLAFLSTILGISELILVFGLWKGKRWGYYLAFIVPIAGLILGLADVGLYQSAPESLNLISASDYIPVFEGLGIGALMLAVSILYLRRGYVKAHFRLAER